MNFWDPTGHGVECTLGPDCQEMQATPADGGESGSVASQIAAQHAPGYEGKPHQHAYHSTTATAHHSVPVARMPVNTTPEPSAASCPGGFDVGRASLHGLTTCQALDTLSTAYGECQSRATGDTLQACDTLVQMETEEALSFNPMDCVAEHDNALDAYCSAQRDDALANGPGAGQIFLRGLALTCAQVCLGPVADAGLDYIGSLFASKVVPAGATRLVIGRVADLTKEGALQDGEFTLLDSLPNQGARDLNVAQNVRVLNQAIRGGITVIRDASPGDLRGEYLNLERAILQGQGWTFDEETSLWHAPPS